MDWHCKKTNVKKVKLILNTLVDSKGGITKRYSDGINLDTRILDTIII